MKYNKVVIHVWRLATEEELREKPEQKLIETCSYDFLFPLTQEELDTKLQEVSIKFGVPQGKHAVSYSHGKLAA